MPAGVAKANLPSKPCAVCGRRFTWRKKWAKVWDEVRYCSEACRKQRKVKVAPEPDMLAIARDRSKRTLSVLLASDLELAKRLQFYGHLKAPVDKS